MPQGKQQYFTAGGIPLVGGKVYTYAAGTTTPLATYTTAAAGTPNTNPVILDSRGEASIFFSAANYKIVVKDSLDSTIWTQDNLPGDQAATILANLAASTGSSLVGYIASGAGAVATTVQDELRKLIRGPTPSAAASVNTTNINAAIAYAASIGAGVDLSGMSYPITNITIQNGLRFLRNGKLIPSGSFGSGAVQFAGGTIGGANVTRCSVSELEIDCTAAPIRGIYGEGVTYCEVKNNTIYGMTASTTAGILLRDSSSYNKITDNTTISTAYATSGVGIYLYGTPVDSYFGYFTNATGNVTQSVTPCKFNQITNNRIYGGQQGIACEGSEQNVISNNSIEAARDRGVIMTSAVRNTVTGNNIYDTHSSGIHMAYGSNQNVVTGNSIKLAASVGEAGIQCYVGSGGNVITGNNISATTSFGIYLAVSSNFNTVSDNRIEAYKIAGICLQSDWDGSGGAGDGTYGRPNYGDPLGPKWAFTPMVGNTVKGNSIGDPTGGAVAAAIALVMLTSHDGSTNYTITGCDIQNNSVYSSAVTHNLFVFSQVLAGVRTVSLLGNTFSDLTAGKVSGTFAGADTFSTCFSKLEGNSTINDFGTWSPQVYGSTVGGAASYSVQSGTFARVSKEYVDFEAAVAWTGHTGTGGITLDLPKAPFVGGVLSPVDIVLENIALTNTSWPAALIGAGNQKLNFYQYTSATGVSLLGMSAAGTIYVSGRYRIAA
jgi:parallel beta-helix repeat protein